ncbi:hypothetical protein CRUP_005533 [Coryphaenoides rupestris]|nr:hypothetical protein CRUP_005533 [Coryphaenoides rupestris]
MSSQVEHPSSESPAERSPAVRHVNGDLFSCPEDDALAHCISEDCRMGAGIAVLFRRKFSGVEELKAQKKLSGQCAVLKRGRRYITKRKASDKPTYDSLRRSLEDMMAQCKRNGVTRISMPRIGCGLDRLKWERVSEMLEQVFQHTDISITVYSLPEKTPASVKPHLRT